MEPPLQAGDELVVAQLGLCAGGLVRTWSNRGGSRLWSVDQPGLLHSLQATGQIARTTREGGRYRERLACCQRRPEHSSSSRASQ